jgi:hypothetical protein
MSSLIERVSEVDLTNAIERNKLSESSRLSWVVRIFAADLRTVSLIVGVSVVARMPVKILDTDSIVANDSVADRELIPLLIKTADSVNETDSVVVRRSAPILCTASAVVTASVTLLPFVELRVAISEIKGASVVDLVWFVVRITDSLIDSDSVAVQTTALVFNGATDSAVERWLPPVLAGNGKVTPAPALNIAVRSAGDSTRVKMDASSSRLTDS